MACGIVEKITHAVLGGPDVAEIREPDFADRAGMCVLLTRGPFFDVEDAAHLEGGKQGETTPGMGLSAGGIRCDPRAFQTSPNKTQDR